MERAGGVFRKKNKYIYLFPLFNLCASTRTALHTLHTTRRRIDSYRGLYRKRPRCHSEEVLLYRVWVCIVYGSEKAKENADHHRALTAQD